MDTLVTIFISKDIECVFKSAQVSNVQNLVSLPLYGYHKKAECCRGGRAAPQHILVIMGTEPAAWDGSSSQTCTCSSPYQQVGEMTSTTTSTRSLSPSIIDGHKAPQPKSYQKDFWIHVNMSLAGLLSSVVVDKTPVDLESVCLIFYSPNDIYQSDLLSLKYPYCYRADATDAQPVPFCIAKVRKQFQSHVQTKQKSQYVLYQFLKLCAFVYQKVLSVPYLCTGLQSHLDRLFGYKSATLYQVSLRIDQLREIQKLVITFLDRYSRIIDDSSNPIQSLQEPQSRNTRSANSSHLSKEPHTSSHSSQFYADTSNTEPTKSHKSTDICHACSTSRGTPPRIIDGKGIKGNGPNNSNLNSSACLVLGRLVCVVVMDLALGALILHWLLSVVSVDGLFSKFGETTQGISDGVLRLLSWLRGAPAGLKLNQPLARALATFFSYHVGLWMLYLEVASGAVYGLCGALVWSGVLGASVQVALLADMLHLATLHLHCIYVYAARLHMVQVSLFGSQWRAFRGHKWNPLKQRVDSLHPPVPVVLSTPNSELAETRSREVNHGYGTRQSLRSREQKRADRGDSGQDCVGSAGVGSDSAAESRHRPANEVPAAGSTYVPSCATRPPEGAAAPSSSKPLSRVLSAVIFTLVVFLLPTTTVFYLVFVSLRLVLFLVRSALSVLAWLLHHNPLYLVLLTLAGSSKLKGDIHFERLHPDGSEGLSGPLLLSLSVRPSGLLTSLRQYAASDVLPSLVAPDMGHLIQTVLYARHLL